MSIYFAILERLISRLFPSLLLVLLLFFLLLLPKDLEPGEAASARLTSKAPKLSELRRSQRPPTLSRTENEQTLKTSFPWQSKDQDMVIPANGTLISTRKPSSKLAASDEENSDDMEDVTIGMHIISNLSDAFTGAVNRASSAFSGIMSEFC
ncbi:unnamed protein product [Dibothriocephalus latus]|uniref:Uncharacterized protein n=1 Tax=Dibothriocephalus latus TaxID=60516 RepID=A0A3P7LHS7_DIBLA|nr:unnamed protein product [Dibothriocephalus latus]